MRKFALDLAARGFAVFPCGADHKRPLTENGFKDATTEPFVIEMWWDQWPEARVGIWPARCEPPLLVIDIDVKNGAPGEANAAALGELLPATIEARTPSGGRHLFYRLPTGTPAIGNRALAPAIDVRSENGYVVVYQPERLMQENASVAPAELIRRLGEAEERADNAEEWLVDPDLPANIERFVTWLRAEAAAGRVAISGQGGNNLTYATAAMARDFGLSAETALAVLWREWNPACVPPWSADELESIVEHAYRYALRPAGSRVDHASAIDEMKAKLAELEDKGVVRREDGHPSAPFRFLSASELRGRPRADALIKGVLYERSLVLMIGPWGQYKSFLALDQAAHLALGRDWAGRRVRSARMVLYIAAEGEAGIANRLDAWERKHGDLPRWLRVLPEAPQFALGGAEQIDQALEAYAKEGFLPSVLYIDTLASVTAGLDESASRDMGAVIEAARRLIRKWHLTIVLIHHTGKDEKRGARGWSGLEGAADGMWLVTADTGELAAVLEVRKAKDSDSRIPAMGFRGEIVKLGEDDDGDPITSIAFSPDQAVAEGSPKAQQRREEMADQTYARTLVQVLTPHPAPGPALAEEMARRLTPGDAEEGYEQRLALSISGWLRAQASKARKGKPTPGNIGRFYIPGTSPAQWSLAGDVSPA